MIHSSGGQKPSRFPLGWSHGFEEKFFVGNLVLGKIYKTKEKEYFSHTPLEEGVYLYYLGLSYGKHPCMYLFRHFANFLVLTGKQAGKIALRALASDIDRPEKSELDNFYLCLEEVETAHESS